MPFFNDSLKASLRCSSGVSADSLSLIAPGSPVRAVELEDVDVRMDVVSASEALDVSGSEVPTRMGIGGWSTFVEAGFDEPGAV